MTNMTGRPLEGLRIVDFTRVMAGPLCTAMLGDLGAEVIKIEDPRGGDITRAVPPFQDAHSTYFAALNRNKLSVALDLKSDAGRTVARELIAVADVVVENFRPGVMSRLGLGWGDVAATNPRLVYASISGFGQDGSFSHLAAYDLIVQAMSGLMHATGQPGGAATAVGESIADASAGLLASWAIMVALYEREKTGLGRHLDVAMMDAVLTMMVTNVSLDLNGAPQLPRRGSRHPLTSPVDSFSASDGDFVLVCFGDAEFRKLATAIGRPDLIDNPLFLTNEVRLKNADALKRDVNAWAADLSVTDAVSALRAADVPCAPMWSLRELDAMGYAAERGLKHTVRTPEGAAINIVAHPVRFGDEQTDLGPTIPNLGADTHRVLKSILGLSPEEIADLRKTGCFGHAHGNQA